MERERGEHIVIRTRHHWLRALRPVSARIAVVIGVLVVCVVLAGGWLRVVALLVLVCMALIRWQEWRDEWLILTNRRLIRVTGIPGTTSTEAWLRLDRVAGIVLTQTVPGKLLGYATMHIEVPGDDKLRRIHFVPEPVDFHARLRDEIFGGPTPPVAALAVHDTGRLGDEAGSDTAPLPPVDDDAWED